MERTITQQQSSGRRTFILLAVIFFGPLLLAAVLFKYGLIPGAETNNGDLVSPPVEMVGVDVPLLHTSGTANTGDLLRAKWTLAYAGSGSCTSVCKQNLYHMQQIWTLTNRDMIRVQRAWFVTDDSANSRVAKVAKDNPNLNVLDASATPLVGQFPDLAENAVKGSDRIYLIDPQGFLMLEWEPTLDPRDILKDLKKLLRHSKSG